MVGMQSHLFTNVLVGLVVIHCINLFSPGMASDPDPLVDFSSDARDFTLRNIFKNGDVTQGPGGTRAALNTSIFPALTSEGITVVLFKLLPCGINPPHTHPRATELVTLISGGPIQTGFVDTHGVPHIVILQPGDVTIFPRALLHFELNIGKTTAFFVSSLNSQNPGTLTAAGALFQLPAETLASALNQTVETVTAINATLYKYGPALQKSSVSGCVPPQIETLLLPTDAEYYNNYDS